MILVVALSVANCSSRYSSKALEQRFVGKSKLSLMQCAGAPSAQQVVGDREILTYATQAVRGYQGKINTDSCRMTFTLQNGRVESVSGNWYGPLINKSRACDRMFNGC